MVKKESNRARKRLDRRLAKGRRASLLEAIADLKERVMEHTNMDEASIENTLMMWSEKSGFDEVGIKGSREVHNGTTFSLEALESMADTLQLWLMCRLFHHWSKTDMSEKTAPYNMSLAVGVKFEDVKED